MSSLDIWRAKQKQGAGDERRYLEGVRKRSRVKRGAMRDMNGGEAASVLEEKRRRVAWQGQGAGV